MGPACEYAGSMQVVPIGVFGGRLAVGSGSYFFTTLLIVAYKELCSPLLLVFILGRVSTRFVIGMYASCAVSC